jgi:arylsulfatase A-like enzyme
MRKRKILLLCLTVTIFAGIIYSYSSFFREPVQHPAQNIIFILIDTLRADHMGLYGYSRDTTPNITALARHGTVFSRVYAVSPWTNPSIATIFTGQYPQAIFEPAEHPDAIRQALPQKATTLAEKLREAGYETVALVDHPGISPYCGYDQGFNRYVMLYAKGHFKAWSVTSPSFILNEFHTQLRSLKGKKLFLYLHLVYPHRPYKPMPEYNIFGKGFQNIDVTEKEGMINQYDGEIRQTDDLIGKAFQVLKQEDFWKDSCLIITADHGEGFWEHGKVEHGNSLFDELLRVPLIVVQSSNTGSHKISDMVSAVDFFPTVLATAGVPLPPGLPGLNLRPYFNGQEKLPERTVFSESPHSFDIHGMAYISSQWKLIAFPTVRRAWLFDVLTDPYERRNLIGQHIDLLPEIKEKLQARRAKDDQFRKILGKSQIKLDEETDERLKALGYIND